MYEITAMWLGGSLTIYRADDVTGIDDAIALAPCGVALSISVRWLSHNHAERM